jgi:hypothetical protein
MSRSRKVASIIAGSVLTLALVPVLVQGQTVEELQAQIEQLLAQLAQLQAQLAQLQGEQPPVPAACQGISFDRNLKQGMTGTDVKCLQALLNTDPETKVADQGPGSPGNETSYFGPLTRAAVIKFQEKYAEDVLAPWNLTTGTGFVGSTTRAKLNELLTQVAPPEVPPEEELPPAVGEFEASLADDNPPAGTLGASSAYNTVLKVKLQAGAEERSVTSVTIERFGLSVDANVDGVLIVDEQGNRHGNVVTFADNVATITFADDPIDIPAGESATFSVQLHMDSGATSGTLGVKVTAVSGDPTGLPLVGNLFTLTSTTNILGSLTVDVVSQTTATVNVDIGTTDYLLTKFRFTAGAAEDVKITKLTLFQNGTVTDDDLQNFDLVDPNGVVLATVAKATDKAIVFDLSDPYTVPKGTQRELSVRLDVVSGSSRTGQLIIQNDFDVVAVGASTGLYILPTAGTLTDTNFPMGDRTSGQTGYNHLTVAAGTLTANKSATSPSGTFGIGASNVTLAVWELEAKGEDIQIQRADIAIGGTSEENDFAGTVRLMTDAGQVLYSTAAPTAATNFLIDDDAAGNDQVTFATYYTIPAGTVLKLKLVVDSSSTIANGETAIGQISDIYYKRMVSNTFATASAGTFISGNTLTASAATLSVVNNDALGNTTVIEGQADVLLGSYLFQTGSSEGVNISSINLDIVVAGQATLNALSNLKLKRADTGAQLGSTVSSPAASNTITVAGQLNIPANTTVQIDAYVNMSTTASDGGTNDTYTTNIDANDVSGVGATSGASINAPSATVTGRTVTAVESGTLTVAIETSGAASSQFFSAGLSGVEMAKIKLSATVEDMKIERLELRTINGSGNIANVKLLGTGLATDPSVPLTAGTAVFTFSAGNEIIVPAYGSRVLTALVDTTSVGTLVAGNLGVLGFGTANALGSGSGVVTQETLTGTTCIAGTACGTLAAGDVIYFTVAGDGTATTDDTPGFAMVTAVTDNTLTPANSLTLEGTANNSWAPGDLITELTVVESILGSANAGTNYDVGEIVYVYDSDDNEARFAIVTTPVASGSPISGLGFSPAGNVAISAATDRVALFTNANSLYGNTMRFEEVEPVITLNAASPSGSTSPSSDQVIAIFDITASGYRDLSFNSLTIEKAGSNSPERYVTDFSLYNGTTRIARVANTTITGTVDDAGANAYTLTGTTWDVCSGNAAANNDLAGISTAEWNTLQIGDKIVVVDLTDNSTTTHTITNRVGDTTIDATCDASDQLVVDTAPSGIATDANLEIRNFRVHFDANQTNTNDVALATQTITAGQTMTLTVKADTSAVRTGITSGTVTFGVSIPGLAGPLEVGTTQVEGLNWDYTPLGPGTAVYKTEGDSYPVSGGTLIY